MMVGERKMVSVSINLFPIAVTAFLVILAVVIIVFKARHARGRVRGRGPFGLFAQPRHTFAQYDEEGEEEGAAEGMNTEGSDAKAARDDRQESG